MTIEGIVARGYGIASGTNKDGIPGPNGEILKDSFVRQRSFFEKKIPGIKHIWTGTINLDISPKNARMRTFDYEITCEWHPGLTETFGVVEGVWVHFKGKIYSPAFIYYPMPSEIHVPRHEIIEILAPKIEGLAYGDRVMIDVSSRKITCT